MASVIGIDIGTQGTKGLLVDERGRQLGSAFRPSSPRRPGPGAVEEDPELQFASVCEVIRECLGASGVDPATVAAVAIAGQMAGLIGIGEDGRNVTPYDSWLDTRCGPYIRQMETAAGHAIATSAGCPPSFNHGPKILWWKHERREVFRAIRSFVPHDRPEAYRDAVRFIKDDADSLGALVTTHKIDVLRACHDLFIHGWTQVIAEVFHIDLPQGPGFDELSRIAAAARTP